MGTYEITILRGKSYKKTFMEDCLWTQRLSQNQVLEYDLNITEFNNKELINDDVTISIKIIDSMPRRDENKIKLISLCLL